MSTLTYSAGRPVYDWETLLQNVLANGTFSAPTGGGTALNLDFGNIHLDLIGTGLTISGGRIITAGTITGFTIVDAGQTVLSMTGLTLPTFADMQNMLNGSAGLAPYSETFKTLFAPFFTNEPVTAVGSNDAESFFGSNGVDHISAGGGDDYVRAGNGVDFLDGGAGQDFIDYFMDVRTVGINIDLSLATQIVVDNNAGAAIVDHIANFENVGGTKFSDIFKGGAENNVFIGGGGGDTFYGGAGDNFYEGGQGADAFYGGTGAGQGQWDKISYEAETGGTGITATFNGGGSVTVIDTYGTVDTGTGIDEIKGSQYNDTINGSAGNDQAEGMAGNDVFNMGAGFDTVEYQHETDAGATHGVIVNLSATQVIYSLAGFTGPQTVAAGHALDSLGGTDTLISVEGLRGTNFADIIVGGDGGMNLEGFDGSDIIYGGSGNDNIRGDDGGAQAGNDILYGGAGDDSFKGGGGNDYIDGGTGWDTINYNLETTWTGDSATHGVIVNLSALALLNVSVAGIASTTVAAGTAIDTRNYVDTLVSIEQIQGTGYDDYIVGSNGDDNLIGNGGNDILIGGQGVNNFWGGAGNDTIVGGTLPFNAMPGAFQDDFLHYEGDGGTQGIVATFTGNGNLTVIDTYGSTDTATSIENVIGSQFDDVFIGDSGNQMVSGMQGNDTFNLGAGFDRVSYESESGAGSTMGIIANLSASSITVNVGNGNETVLSGHVRDSFGYTDTLSGVEMISGTNNADYILMSSGDDTIKGGGGNDYLNGGLGFDTINYNLETTFTSDSATHGVIVNMSSAALVGVSVAGIATTTVAAGTAIDTRNFTDTLVSIEHIQGTGYDDIIVGSDAGNQLEGDGGNDKIVGGLGADTLNGGLGNDTLVGSLGFDTLIGGGGVDTIDYSGLVSAGLTAVLDGSNGYALKGGANGTDTLTGITDILGNNGSDIYVLKNGTYGVTGGSGNDIYIVDNGGDTITEAANGGWDAVLSSATSFILPVNVEYLQLNANNATGTDANASGTWALEANGTNDTLVGGLANDIYVVHNAATTITDTGGTNTVISYSSFTLSANVLGTDILALVGNNTTGTGNNLGDVLQAFGTGDTLIGGTGNDLFEVTSTSDVVQEAPGGGFDTLWSVVSSYVLPSNVEEIVVLQAGGTGIANAAGGILVSGSSNDILQVNAGSGSATLYGNGLGTTFRFAGAGFGHDVIGGFTEHNTGSATPDVIDLTALHLAGLSGLAITGGLSGAVPITTITINGDATDQIILYGTLNTHLIASDFLF